MQSRLPRDSAARIAELEAILNLFRVDRMLHVIFALGALFLMGFVVINSSLSGKFGSSDISCLFGSGGIFVYTIGRYPRLVEKILTQFDRSRGT